MSRSNPTTKNPATRFFRWSGGEEAGGKVTWYDKDTETNKEMPLPFSFLVLDELNTIAGFSDADHSSYWANEVRNLQNDGLVVRTGAGIKARGLYKDAAIEAVKARGAKYAKSVYIAFKDETGELVIGNFKLIGAALTSWIEFQKRFDVYKCAVQLVKADGPMKKGSTKYFVPIFNGQPVAPETDAAAKALDKELQAYLSDYLSQHPTDSEAAEDEDDGQDGVKADDYPANEPAKEEDSVDLSEVPF